MVWELTTDRIDWTAPRFRPTDRTLMADTPEARTVKAVEKRFDLLSQCLEVFFGKICVDVDIKELKVKACFYLRGDIEVGCITLDVDHRTGKLYGQVDDVAKAEVDIELGEDSVKAKGEGCIKIDPFFKKWTCREFDVVLLQW
jgi:hypothetical protein